MKKLKKILSLLLSFALILTMTSFAAFAAESDTYAITINNDTEGYTYVAYQIFSGDYDADEKTLSNITWGEGVDTSANGFDAAVLAWYNKYYKTDTEDAGTATSVSAAQVAAVLAQYNDDSDAVVAFAEMIADYVTGGSTSTYDSGVYTISDLSAGYYLVKNTAVPTSGEGEAAVETGAYTAYILKVVGDVTVDPKSDVPSVTKEIADYNDSTTTDATWGTSADYDIGDNVEFRITGTVADNIASYDEYTLTFYDTLEHTMSLNEDSIVVTLYTSSSDTEGIVLTKYDDLADNDGYTVTTGSADATNCEVCGTNVNDTTITITVSDLIALGATDSAYVVITYDAELTDDAHIASNYQTNTVYMTYSNNPYSTASYGTTPESTVYVYTYELVVTKTDGSDNPLSGAGFTLYKKVTEDTAGAVTLEGYEGYYIAVGSEQMVDGDDTDGYTASWEGIDDGDYVLVETTTPDGYTTAADVTFTVSATHTDDPSVTVTSSNADVSVSEGTLSTTVVNKDSSLLPTTGGIGTKIFYILGTILVLGAGILLVVKRRVREEE